MDDKPRLRAVEVFPVEGREGQVCVRDATGLSEHMVTGAVGIVRLLRLLDGEHNLLDLQAQLTRETGEIVMSDDVRRMLDVLDEALLLEGEHFETWRRERVEAFAASPVREASSAGVSYPDDASELRAFLDEILSGAEAAPLDGTPRAIIAPHIDHLRGRRCYADAYAPLAACEGADLYILLGTSHVPTVEPFVLTRKDFETPLGVAHTDVDAIDMILERSGRDLEADEFVHRGEHSIELNLVFLQHLAERSGRACRIVPILCGSFTEAMVEGRAPETPGVAEMVAALRDVVADGSRRVMIVTCADLAHVGPRFGGERRVTERALADLDRIDRETLAHIERGDADGFYEFVARDENARNICSVAPIWLTLKALEPCEATLVRYDQWCADDGSSCVTFAACVVS